MSCNYRGVRTLPRKYSHRRYGRSRPLRWLVTLALLAVVVLLVKAALPRFLPSGRSGVSGPGVNLLDKNQRPVLAGTPGWEYHRSLQTDLDQDGATETIEVIARVARTPGNPNEFAWDDGQPWQVYVQDGSKVTYVYNRFVQLGQLQVFTTDESKPRIAIAESQGAGYALYAISYSGPGNARSVQLNNLPVNQHTW